MDSCGVRGNTHIWRNACCVVRWLAARKTKGVERGEMEKGRSVMIHIGGIAGGVLYTLVVNKLLQLSQSMEGKAIAHMNPELNLKKKIKRAPR